MENKIFGEMKKEKTDKDIDDLTKQMERLVTLVERRDGRDRYRNYERRNKYKNYDRREDYNERSRNIKEVECWTCHEKDIMQQNVQTEDRIITEMMIKGITIEITETVRILNGL